ncbi:MAG: SAM-dependent methyltransferase, partial [Oscillospiraceae bacterium]
MAEPKIRLDVAIFERGLTESRAKAGAFIMAGQVYVNGQKAVKAGLIVKAEDNIEIRGDKLPFVSRGGLKLDKAIKSFGFNLIDKVCMDIGASTGGFTDCMLQNGAKKVFSVDVGYGQLA